MSALKFMAITAAAFTIAGGAAGAANATTVVACTDTLACSFDGTTGGFVDKVARHSSTDFEFDFSSIGAGKYSVDFSSNVIKLSNVSFAGTAFTPTYGTSYSFDVPGTGLYKLLLTATNLSNAASTFSGTVDFAPTAVPETGSWAMMILGVGAVGGVARRGYRKSAARATA